MLGIIFTLKYAIVLISPQMRMLLSFALGVILWSAGISFKKENLRTTAHTLAASGLAVCYASCFAAYHFYHMLPPYMTVAVLADVSLTAFATAVRKNAPFICVLAQCTGFLTPFLVSTATPNWTAFLIYTLFIALASGAAALRRKWNGQLILCAVFTALCQLVTAGQTGTDVQTLQILMSFSLVFGALFAAASFIRQNGTPFLISAAACMAALWHLPNAHMLPDGFWSWYIAAFVFFTAVPFLFKQRFIDDKPVWTAACVAGLAGIQLYFALTVLYNLPQGLIPLFFALVYGGLTVYAARWKTDGPVQSFRLAWLGATSAFFLTFAIVCQFKREWLTLMLALEGGALIYLNRLFAHKGLTWLGKALLTSACVRLTLNPFVANYYPQAAKIFNWYLYTYALAAGAMWAGAKNWLPREDKTSRGYLQLLAGITLFALVNIEIADYFAVNGHQNWNMFGDLTVAAAFTVAWAVCGAVCLLGAFVNGQTGLRQAGIGLICLAIAKLFLSDIWQLALGARIIVLISVAILLILISFIYQYKRKMIR